MVRAAGITGSSRSPGCLGRKNGFASGLAWGNLPLEDGREVKAGGKDYLLSPMRKQELAVLDEVLDRAKSAVEMVLTKGVGAAMNEFNRTVVSC